MEARTAIDPLSLEAVTRSFAHDIRGPLFVLDGCLEMAELGALDLPDLLARLRLLQADLRIRIESFTDSLRVVAALPDRRPEPTSLRTLVEDLRSELTPVATALDLTLELPTPAAVRIDADFKSLRRILLNLLSRGLRQARPGGTVRLEHLPSPLRLRAIQPERDLQAPPADAASLLADERLELAAAVVLASDLGVPLRWELADGTLIAELELKGVG